MNDRYVVVGLARSRSRWFSEMTRWSTSSMIPVDYMKAISADEVRAILGSGRQVSALVADASVPGVDRELISLALESAAIVIIVAEPAVRRDWAALGAAAVLDDDFTPEELTETLRRAARALGPTQRRSAGLAVTLADPGVTDSRSIAVTGPGGTGASTIAMALAQGLAESARGAPVALVDGARQAHLAMYHDVGDVIPGLPELIDAHRGDRPDPDQIRELFFQIESRGYSLLLGQRRARDSASLGPLSTMAALNAVRRVFDPVIFDVDPQVDGESETGSIDIENHHGVTRAVADMADLILFVVKPGMKGMHDLTHLVDSFGEFGVARERLVPVVNFAPRGRVARAALTRTVAQLTEFDGLSVRPPVFVPHIRAVEDVHNCASRLPAGMTVHLGRVVNRLLADMAAPEHSESAGPTISRIERNRIEVA